MASSNLTSGRARVRISPDKSIYTAIIEGRFARFYAGKRLVMVQQFPSNPEAVREAVSFIETMGGNPQVQLAPEGTGCLLAPGD